MKKSKFVLATLAAAVFATSAAGLAACSKSNGGGEDEEYTITFDANGSYFGTDTTATTKEVETIEGLALQPTPAVRSDGYTFNGYTFTKDGDDAVASTYIFTDSITVYASWINGNGGGNGGQQQNPTGVLTITLDANGGTLGAISSLQTSGGQLTALPLPPTPPANKEFKGWFSAATGGTEITTDTVFTVATTIFAQWNDVGGGNGGGGNGGGGGGGNSGGQTVTATGNDVYVGGTTVKYNLIDNTSEINSTLYPTQDAEWMLLSKDFTAGEEISVKINGADIVLSKVEGFGASAWTSSSITIKNTASFNVYVKHWSDTGNWTVWMSDGSTDAIPDNGSGGGGGGGGSQSQTTGFQVNGGAVQALVKNTQTDTSDGRDKEYFIEGNAKVHLDQGDVITFVVEGQPISAFIFGSSVGVDKSDIDNEQSSFTITTTGDFKILLRYYPNEGDPNKDPNWTAEFGGPVSINQGGSIPQGAAKCEVTFGTGTVTLYMKKDGAAVTNLSGYNLYCWNDGTKLFGDWPGMQMVDGMSTNLGSLTADTGVIINWNNGAQQTSNISGLTVGHTYVVTLINQDFEISQIS